MVSIQQVNDEPMQQEIQADAFLTPTDMMKSLNKALHELTDAQDEAPFFQLQRRRQDGSTRPASASEKAAHDLQTQINQAVARVQELPDDRSRLAWAEAQRSLGNELYKKKEFKQAIDVYLTCLPAVVIDEERAAQNKMRQDGDDGDSKTTKPGKTASDGEAVIPCDRTTLFLKILNNLVLSALQLKWYKKADEFACIAIDHWDKHVSPETKTTENMLLLAKTYFRRSKSRRLRGNYSAARSDLSKCIESMKAEESNVDEVDTTDLQAMSSSVEKERALLSKAESEAAKNLEKQRASLQKAMSPSHCGFLRANDADIVGPCNVPRHRRRRREYSTVKAPKPRSRRNPPRQSPRKHSMTPWENYVATAGRVADQALKWIGDGREMYSERVSMRRKKNQ